MLDLFYYANHRSDSLNVDGPAAFSLQVRAALAEGFWNESIARRVELEAMERDDMVNVEVIGTLFADLNSAAMVLQGRRL